MDGSQDGNKQPISLKDATGTAILGHIEALEWMDGSKLLVRANDLVEVVDFSNDVWNNYTLFDTEALVSGPPSTNPASSTGTARSSPRT